MVCGATTWLVSCRAAFLPRISFSALSMRIPSAPQPRYHFVDTTRAAMMLLGVALHARLSFTGAKRDDDLTGAADSFSQLAYYFIHLFRMPVFFLIAGFCAALIYQRRGAAEFVRNRF